MSSIIWDTDNLERSIADINAELQNLSEWEQQLDKEKDSLYLNEYEDEKKEIERYRIEFLEQMYANKEELSKLNSMIQNNYVKTLLPKNSRKGGQSW